MKTYESDLGAYTWLAARTYKYIYMNGYHHYSWAKIRIREGCILHHTLLKLIGNF